MTKRKVVAEPMHFINIDLEIGSKRSLAPLIVEMAQRKAYAVFVGPLDGLSRAHYEVNLSGADADKTAMALVRLVERLSVPAMKAWRNAKVRDFNIGIQSSDVPSSFEVVSDRPIRESDYDGEMPDQAPIQALIRSYVEPAAK